MTDQSGARRAWITGGGSGLGRALALRMARDGWQVAISGRRREPLDEVRAKGGERVHPFPCDVTDRAQVAATVAAIESEMGSPDLCVLNAGVYRPFKPAEFDAQPFHDTMTVNYLGAVNCVDALLPGMRARGGGRLVFTASVAGYRGLPNAAPYGAAKAALIHLAESLKLDLHRFGIQVSVINPGFVRTPLTEQNDFSMPALMEPDAAADAMYAGIRSERFEVTFPKRFTWSLKLLRMLPYTLYFPLIRRGMGKR